MFFVSRTLISAAVFALEEQEEYLDSAEISTECEARQQQYLRLYEKLWRFLDLYASAVLQTAPLLLLITLWVVVALYTHTCGKPPMSKHSTFGRVVKRHRKMWELTEI